MVIEQDPPKALAALLTFIAGDFGDRLNLDYKTLAKSAPIPALSNTETHYRLLYPHQFPQFVLQAPFFYQDDQRAYFVTPQWIFGDGKELSKPTKALPISRKAL